jgi:tetratricopeptide (TPR) repeat protein
MDTDLFLQNLRDLSLEEGKVYIQDHIDELSDYAAVGNLLADEALRLLYSPFVSLKLAELLIFFGDYVQHMSSHALGLKAKGDALKGIGHHQAAMECLDTAGDEFLRLGDECNWARSRISWIISCASLGRVEVALQQAALAREVFLRNGENYWACVIDENTAAIYVLMGRYHDALNLYERILPLYTSLTDQSETFIERAIAIAENNQAIYLSLLGNFEKAYYLLQQAQTRFLTLEEAGCVINTEINLADLDYAQSYYGSALRRYYQARDSLLQNHLEDPLLLAELKLRMADCLMKLNRTGEACSLADEASESFRRFGISLSTGNALCEYATILMASNRVKEALVILNEAEILFSKGGFHHHAAATKLQQAELFLMIGSEVDAYKQAVLVGDYFDSQGLVAYSVRAKLVVVSAHLEEAKLTGAHHEKGQQSLIQAVTLCKQAALQARQHNLQELVYKSQYLLGRLAAFQGNLSKAAKHYGAAIAQIERILNDLVFDLSPSFLHTTWTVYEDMIDLCLRQSQVERAFSYLEQARSMALRQYLSKSSALNDRQGDITSSSLLQINGAAIFRLQQELKDWQENYRNYCVLLENLDASVSPTIDREVIQQELRRCEAKISELFERLHLHQSNIPATSHSRKRATRETKDVDITQLRQQLLPGQLLLSYFLYQGNLVIFAATKEQLITHENPDGVAQLEHLLPLLYAHLQPAGWPDPQRPPQKAVCRLLNKLYNLLVEPVASLLPVSPGSLIVVPYGLLHKLPFHALYDGSHFLIEEFQVSYLPASSVIAHFVAGEKGKVVRSVNNVVSTKPPLVFGYSENGHLQRVFDESKAVASLLHGQCFLEGEATITRLVKEASGNPVIHLATHGQSRMDAPNFSFIRLADGQLNAIDVFSLDLKGCELVTLSGCETGLSLSGGGDEQLGLGRAFLAAGADSLLISAWQVEDNATNELMQLFYQNLLKGESKVQAIRAAQCSLLYRTESIYSHPYFWAAFRLVGEVGPLIYQGVNNSTFTIEVDPQKELSLIVSHIRD